MVKDVPVRARLTTMLMSRTNYLDKASSTFSARSATLGSYDAPQADDQVVPGDFDFVYLRFDFNNCCNVSAATLNSGLPKAQGRSS